MPGCNQRGPMNQGPMTGRKRGYCAGNQDAQSENQQNRAMGSGMGMAYGRGRNRCAAPGWSMPNERSNAAVNQKDTHTEQVLQDRAQKLEAELSAIKDQLKKLSAHA